MRIGNYRGLKLLDVAAAANNIIIENVSVWQPAAVRWWSLKDVVHQQGPV